VVPLPVYSKYHITTTTLQQNGCRLSSRRLKRIQSANFSREVRSLFLAPLEQGDADNLVTDLKCFEKVNKALQGQGKTKDTPRLTVAQAREVLDKLIERFPGHRSTKVNMDSPLVTHPVWEEAIIKLQNDREDNMLTTAEKREVKRYYLVDLSNDDGDGDESNDDDDDDDDN
jgi:hypothetical protein